jgi:glycosyltransferase involved in cell wall biosynthesis
LRAVDERADTVFTNVAEVTDALPSATFSHAVTATDFYGERLRPERDELRLVFAADDRPRKGLPTLIDAFNQLGEGFHLDLVGPHRRHLSTIANPHFEWHGWLSPEELREVYWNADVFVSPATLDVGNDENAEPGTVDGFPSSTAVDAMATGMCLVTSNPRREHRVVRPGEHYIEVPDRDPDALAGALRELRADPTLRRRVAVSGMRRIREVMAVDRGVSAKLEAMGFHARQRIGQESVGRVSSS